MNRILSLALLFSLAALFSVETVFSQSASQMQQLQSLGFDNIQDVNVDELSDDEVMRFYRQAQAQGLTIQEIGDFARARGLSASEVAKLRSRITQIQATTRNDGTDAGSGTRSADPTSLLYLDSTEEDTTRDNRMYVDGVPIFGSELFSSVSRSFEPSLNIPTPVGYTLGVDDEIIINIWGAAEADYNLIIDPEGNIRVPNLGPIQISGLSIEDARERILNRLTNIYSGLNLSNPDQGNTFADVSLGNIRSINVNIIGEIKQPGSYTVSSLASVFNLLYAAGGPNQTGSWRSIEVIRGDEIVETFDLYDLLVHGNPIGNIRLKDQDVIKVNPYQNRVRLLGEVKRPGIFELKDGESLDNLIEFTGGFSEEAYKDRIVLKRVTNIQRSISDVKWPDGGDIVLRNGDEVEITNVVDRFENRVAISGAVYKPGDYELSENMTLLELIEKAEGLKDDVYMDRGIIFRSRDNLILESIPFSLSGLMDGTEEDIVLRRDDEVRISSLFEMREEFRVSVNGAVNQTGEFEFLEDMTLEDAIFLAKGLRDEAAAYRVEVARRVVDRDTRTKVNQIAEVFQFEIDENFRFKGDDSEFELQPFDQIFVRAKPNYQRQMTVRIEGEVQFPGEYVLEQRDARLTDLIEQAGGLSDFAYAKGASMQRILDIVVTEEDSGGDLMQRANLNLLNLDDVEVERSEAVNDTIITPVGIRLADALENPNGRDDIRLQEGDVIRVPREFQTIRVEGGVLSPVSMRYVPGRGVQGYISAAGGTTDRGQRHRAYIVYANGEVDRTKRFLFIRSNPSVEPGATIIVPEKPASEQMSPQERLAIATSLGTTVVLFLNILDRL